MSRPHVAAAGLFRSSFRNRIRRVISHQQHRLEAGRRGHICRSKPWCGVYGIALPLAHLSTHQPQQKRPLWLNMLTIARNIHTPNMALMQAHNGSCKGSALSELREARQARSAISTPETRSLRGIQHSSWVMTQCDRVDNPESGDGCAGHLKNDPPT